MARFYYGDSIANFLAAKPAEILGHLARASEFADEPSQKAAWVEQIAILGRVLKPYEGAIYFEYSIPRMGKRIDTVLLIGSTIFVVEFKVGEDEFPAAAIDQVCDYALDLKNFHDASHAPFVAPILVSTNAREASTPKLSDTHADKLLPTVKTNAKLLGETIEKVLKLAEDKAVSRRDWEGGRYCPTPTIIEAAMALYAGHSVADISRNDAGATNLTRTSEAIAEIIHDAKKRSRKAICFLTGVPGAGKTLVGLNTATKHTRSDDGSNCVFLSGNGPLVAVLREALARDSVVRAKTAGKKLQKSKALSEVQAFIQNIHHFRDDCLESERPPVEHVALFDEAQRAWDLAKTVDFMKRKKGRPDFKQSEPEFLISCLDRHQDWAVIVCLVGGGQEIHTGEDGISGWIEALNRSYPDWDVHVSSRLVDSEYSAGKALSLLRPRRNVSHKDALHLAVSMRSFRSEDVALLAKQLLDLELAEAKKTFAKVASKDYPICLTRDVNVAKKWLRTRARGLERYGLVASSQAERLRPHAIDVRIDVNPVHWFLQGKEDVRSSYYLEDVATEFLVQGLELDWACVTWDADFRFDSSSWQHWEFKGDRWNKIRKAERQSYLKNAYRVLLTRARQGMVILVPHGDPDDQTRLPKFYDQTYEYLTRLGIPIVS